MSLPESAVPNGCTDPQPDTGQAAETATSAVTETLARIVIS
jgi:hypothetical protein